LSTETIAVPDRQTLRQALPAQRLQTLRLIHAVLTLTPVLLAAVALLLAHQSTATGAAPRTELGSMLLLATAAVAIGSYAAAGLLPALLLKPETLANRIPAGLDAAGWAGWAANQYQVLLLIRLSLLEAPAIMGAVALFVAAPGGGLEAEPLLWLALLPIAIHLVAGWSLRPAEQRLLDWFEQRIAHPLRARG
jgi:hypothetical protein